MNNKVQNNNQVCTHFLSGNCKFGERCRYAHPKNNNQQQQPQQQQQQYQQRRWPQDQNSNFRPQQAQQQQKSNAICRFFQQGKCKYGNQCKLQHVFQQPKICEKFLMHEECEEKSGEYHIHLCKYFYYNFGVCDKCTDKPNPYHYWNLANNANCIYSKATPNYSFTKLVQGASQAPNQFYAIAQKQICNLDIGYQQQAKPDTKEIIKLENKQNCVALSEFNKKYLILSLVEETSNQDQINSLKVFNKEKDCTKIFGIYNKLTNVVIGFFQVNNQLFSVKRNGEISLWNISEIEDKIDIQEKDKIQVLPPIQNYYCITLIQLNQLYLGAANGQLTRINLQNFKDNYTINDPKQRFSILQIERFDDNLLLINGFDNSFATSKFFQSDICNPNQNSSQIIYLDSFQGIFAEKSMVVSIQLNDQSKNLCFGTQQGDFGVLNLVLDPQRRLIQPKTIFIINCYSQIYCVAFKSQMQIYINGKAKTGLEQKDEIMESIWEFTIKI